MQRSPRDSPPHPPRRGRIVTGQTPPLAALGPDHKPPDARDKEPARDGSPIHQRRDGPGAMKHDVPDPRREDEERTEEDQMKEHPPSKKRLARRRTEQRPHRLSGRPIPLGLIFNHHFTGHDNHQRDRDRPDPVGPVWRHLIAPGDPPRRNHRPQGDAEQHTEHGD